MANLITMVLLSQFEMLCACLRKGNSIAHRHFVRAQDHEVDASFIMAEYGVCRMVTALQFRPRLFSLSRECLTGH